MTFIRTRNFQKFHFLTFFALTSVLKSAWSVEEDRPAIFLSARNFNPHPYQAAFQQNPDYVLDVNKLGPVVFPPAPEDNSVRSNIITIGREERKLNHPIDDHPYSKVARKYKYRFPGRFTGKDNRINPRVYEALSSHAAKVLSEPASRLGKDYTISSLSDQKKNYAFSYKVLDHLTGDDFAHTQSQNSQATNGEYRVKLPDGRLQIVSYIADKNGYKADVKYTENDPPSQNIQIQHIPTRNQIPYDYRYDPQPQPVVYAPVQSTVAPEYGIYVTATPTTHVQFLREENPQHVHQQKVQIFTGDGNYVGSTVAPWRENVVLSTAAPGLEEYFDVLGNQRHHNRLGYRE